MSHQEALKTMKESNYRKIIEAFERILFENERDISQVIMNKVAEDSGFTKRTIYKYFGSKEELLFEVMIRGYKQMHLFLNESIDEKHHQNQLYVVAKAFYEFSKEYSDYYYLIMNYQTKQSDFDNPTKRVSECYRLGQVTMDYIVNSIKVGVESGDFRAETNIIESTLLVWSFASGLLNNMDKKFSYIHEYYGIDCDKFVLDGLKKIIKILE